MSFVCFTSISFEKRSLHHQKRQDEIQWREGTPGDGDWSRVLRETSTVQAGWSDFGNKRPGCPIAIQNWHKQFNSILFSTIKNWMSMYGNLAQTEPVKLQLQWTVDQFIFFTWIFLCPRKVVCDTGAMYSKPRTVQAKKNMTPNHPVYGEQKTLEEPNIGLELSIVTCWRIYWEYYLNANGFVSRVSMDIE